MKVILKLQNRGAWQLRNITTESLSTFLIVTSIFFFQDTTDFFQKMVLTLLSSNSLLVVLDVMSLKY